MLTLTVRRANDRGHANHGWLDSHHTFSFSDYYDPAHMGFRALRVINEDRIQPATGFPTHAHRDMEIISYVLEGGIEHKDSMGNGSVIRPGDVQRMSAGTGVRHSEFNASKSAPAHFLQIWIQPDRSGFPPSYEQATFTEDDKRGKLRLVASADGRDGSVHMNADASVFAGILREGDSLRHEVRPGRYAWVHVARGQMRLNGQAVEAGDGISTSGEGTLTLEGTGFADVLVFDLA